MNTKLEIMNGRYQRRNLLVDEIEMLPMLLRNKIGNITQDEFAQEMNHFVYEEARPRCEGCEMDDPSQMHHDCIMNHHHHQLLLFEHSQTVVSD